MAAIPTLDEEDAKRRTREHENLVGERTRITNRLKAAFIRLGIRGFNPKLRRAPQRLATLRTPEDLPIPPNTLAELQRDMARFRFLTDQIKEIERTVLEELRSTPEQRPHAMVQLLARIGGAGIQTANMLVNGVLSRNLRDRRAVAPMPALADSSDESGRKRREKGPAKAGNARVRRGMIQLAWRSCNFRKIASWFNGTGREPRAVRARPP